MLDSENGKVVRTIEVDFDSLEHTFLYPSISRLKKWLSRSEISTLELRLEYHPGIFILTELSFDDSDLGVFFIEYVDRLIELGTKERQIDWTKPAAIIDRRLLRPVPELMLDYLARNSGDLEIDFHRLAEQFLTFLSERSHLTLLSNENYRQFSAFGESDEEFKQLCFRYAGAEKSERALALEDVFKRKILQLTGRLEKEAPAGGGAREELARTGIEDLDLACKSLLTKSINLFILEQHPDFGWRAPDIDNYLAALTADIDRLGGRLDLFKEEFAHFAKEIVEVFGDLEQEVNAKAMEINTVEVPLAKCAIQLLRVSQVWLPYWQGEFREGGESRSELIKAF